MPGPCRLTAQIYEHYFKRNLDNQSASGRGAERFCSFQQGIQFNDQRAAIRRHLIRPIRSDRAPTELARRVADLDQSTVWQQQSGEHGLSKFGQRPPIRESFGRAEGFCQFAKRFENRSNLRALIPPRPPSSSRGRRRVGSIIDRRLHHESDGDIVQRHRHESDDIDQRHGLESDNNIDQRQKRELDDDID